MDALARGDNPAARQALTQLQANGNADASVNFALAIACRRMHDGRAALQAVEMALAADPGNFQYLLMKADLLADQSAQREASAFYAAAVNAAAGLADPPEQLKAEIARARQMCSQLSSELERLITARLATIGELPGEKTPPSSPRINEALDILLGRAQPFVQRPRYFHFPGLPAISFFPPDQFDWIPELEGQTGAIRAELEMVLHDHNAFAPYVEHNPHRPGITKNEMVNNADWSAFYLWKNGKLVAENAARCPATVKAMSAIPLTTIANRSPSVLFSLLRPGAHIPAHNGLINTRLIAHLPLIVPGKCRFRVGNDTREWQAGKIWVFDDTIEHEAWNDSDETRVILLFEVNRPDISAAEQQLVAGIFEAIDSHSGKPPEWEI